MFGFKKKDRNIILRDMAKECGLCDEWFNDWGENNTASDLIDKYKRGMDFSLLNDWLPNEKIKQLFTRDELIDNGVFVDDSGVIAGSGTFVVNGSSHVDGIFTNMEASKIYIRHSSVVNILATDMAVVHISLHDNASVEVSARGSAKVIVYSYGHGKVIRDGNVIVRNRLNFYTK